MDGGVTSLLNDWWAPALAFAAGVVSFASPCILPVVPGYTAFVSGQAQDERRPAVPMLLFVLGFAFVFTAIGAFTRTFQPIFTSTTGLRVAGVFVLAFGIFMLLYALRLGGAWLYAERRPLLSRVKPGRATAFPLGMAFAAGWTPCIGPVLGGILGLAAAQGGGAWGATLMFSYSLGLGVPFILMGLGVRRLMGAFGLVQRNYHWISAAGGVTMLFIGTLLVLDLWELFLARTGLLNLVNGFTPPI